MQHHDLSAAELAGFEDFDNHCRVRAFSDPETGLRAWIAVHNINIGPALGGCRMYPYGSEREAIRDVLRLSRGMTYKNALAGLPLGGGKSVILGNPATDKTEALMLAMGRAVHTLGGDYISAEDSGTNERDMAVMKRETPYVMGQRSAEGELGGDPSPVTAYGVFCGIGATLARKFGSPAVEGITFAVQGLGAVGYDLCRALHHGGARLVVTDTRKDVITRALEEFPGTQAVAPEEIFAAQADVFSPCALGAQINEDTIPLLKASIVAGAANNQMATEADHDRLAARGILYAPDYAINAGGVIAVGYEYFAGTGSNPFPHPLTRACMMEHAATTGKTLDRIFNIAQARALTPGRAADELAEAIFCRETGPDRAAL